MSTTGQRIKKRSKKLGYTQKRLAELAEISEGEMSLIIHDKRALSAPVLIALADALYTTTDYLLCRTEIEDFFDNPRTHPLLHRKLEFVIYKFNTESKIEEE